MEEHINLIDEIYESAVVPELWPRLLLRLCAVADAKASALCAFDMIAAAADPPRPDQLLTTPAYELAYTSWAKMGRDLENVRPKRALSQGYHGFQGDLELCTLSELQSDPIYQRFLYPNGIGWTAGATIPVPGSGFVIFDFCRGIDTQPFDRASMEALDTYRPHLVRSAFVAARLGLERARVATDTLLALGLPGAAIRPSGRVLSANPLFLGLSPRIMVGARDRLFFASQRVGLQFENALDQIGTELTPSIRSIPIRASDGEPALVVHLVPIRRSAHDIFVGCAALVVITPVVAAPAPLADLLAGLFDLSPAEAKLARALSSGATVARYATDNRLSPETVRGQLKSVLAKTGQHRQTDLARLLAPTAAFGGVTPQA